VPKRHQGRDEDSEPLSLGDFVDIWASLRQCEADDDTKDTVWLVIDGLEACGDEIFLQFWNSLEQLRKRQVDSKKPLALLKVLFTGTLTPAMIAVAGGVSRYSVSPDLIKQDIARYVDTRLNRCIDSESLLDIKDNVENLRQEIKEGSSDYWPFARDATAEVELMLGRNLAKVASFTGRLPRKLEMHLQQTLVSLRQSIGSSRYLYPLLIILVSNQGGPELNIYQLKDALSSLYSANEVQKLDLADLVLRHCGGLLTWTGTGSLYFRHSGFVDSLGQKVTDARRKANLAYVCMTYLLQDHFKAMPLPANFKDPLVWLNENHPFYAYAVENCLEFVAAAGGDDGRLPPLFLRLFLEDCPQWKMAREWIKVCPSYQSPYEDFETLAIMPIIRDERLLPILERVCPPPPDLTEFSLVQRTKHQLRAWCRPAGNHMPQFALPKEWLKARTDREHTPLLAAARQGNVNAVRYILKWHPNVNERGGPDMRSILMMLYCSQSFGTPEERSARLTAITSDLLQRGADLNLGDKRGSCPLHVACDQASLPLTRLLLDNGADINISDQDGCTAWQIACERRFPDLLGELVERDVEVDSLFDSGETALTYLTRCGWLKCLRVVVPKADVNIIDRTGVAPIHRAVQVEANRYEILELLISKPGINLDALQSRVFGDNNPERATALLIAITANDHRAAEMLLRAGASSHYMPGLEVLPLELAVRRGNRAIVELLLRHRAPVNEFLITRRKQTALSTAATACSVDMLKLLLDYGADPTIEDGLQLPNAAQLIVESKSPNVDALKLLLDCPNPPAIVQSQSFAESEHVDYSEIFIKACSIKETQFVRALLDHGVELSTWLKLPEQFSPLHAAVRSGNLEVCHILLEKEPRFLNMFCRCGSNMFSPLHEACCTGQLEIAKFLLEQGADVKLLTPHEERSCLLLACTFSSPEMVEVILAADPSMADVPSFTGSSPLQHSSGRGQVKVTEELIKAGASLSKWHLGRYSCISRTVFHMMGPLAIPMVRLYVKHGLDINVPITAFGHTTFHCAIGAGHPAVIRWMHAQGGNGIRTCRISEKSEVWELGLRAMGQNMSPEVIEMLLASNRETLADMDWSRQNALGSFSFGRKAYLSRLHWLCEEIRADTSQDIFAAMMVEPDLFGITPLDRSIGIRKCRPESHARVAKVTLAFIESYLEMPNWALLGEIKMLLTAKLEYYIPEDLAPVMTLHYSVPGLKTLPDGQVEQSSTTHSRRCLTCRWPIFERCSFCIKCELASCSACLGGDKQPPCERAEKHLWVAFALDSTVSVQSVEVQAAFGRIKAALLRKSEDLQDGLRDSSIAVSVKEDDGDETNHLQSSLQLATLHAFNMLAIRRSIGTIYLPLSVHAIKLISPFQGHIAEMRKFHERKMLDEESTLERRMEEMRYMSSAIGRMAYADEGLFRQDMVLGEMARLFSETVTA
jgi:ankyrin repeat protein